MASKKTLFVREILTVTIVFFVFSNFVFAQEESIDAVNNESATTTEAVTKEVEPWYRLKRISGGNKQVGDFVVGPGRIEVELNPGETKVVEINVTNRISDNRTFKLVTEDVAGSEDKDTALVLLGEERGPYSLLDYVSYPNDQFTLNLGDQAYIPVTISVPADAEPGGYYGSVLVQTVRTKDLEAIEGDAAPRSPVIARIGTLLFIKVKGDENYEGGLSDFSTIDDKLWYESGPVNFGVLYENTGNQHVNPYGELRITNIFGEEVGFVEIEPWFVLPKSLRLREITWDREYLLGMYRVELNLNRGYEDVVDTEVIRFWVLPWKFLVAVFGGLFVLIFLIRLFFRTFEFKRKS